MPIVLLLLGAVTTAAGLALIGSGLSFRDGIQTDILTPGTIAAVGGLLLIAFGLAVREMRRIERVFVARPPSQPPHIDDAIAATGFATAPPLPSPADSRLGPMPAAAVAAEAQADEAVIERLRAKIPTIPRVENGRATETADVSQALRDTAGLDESAADVKGLAAVARAANGAGSSVRSMPRMDLKPRLAAAPDKGNPADKGKVSVFNSFWPAAPRSDSKEVPRGAAPARAPQQDPRVVAEPAPAATGPGSAAVSVLKSGVVEGMAYTLYSDGSIEAQLPQGTLRFGSITALRNHIESNP
jgi:hypothetical protein